MKIFLSFLVLITSFIAKGDNIGLGKVDSIKEYDFNSNKSIKIYLETSATLINSACKENGRVYGTITTTMHDSDTINRMFSMTTAAYFSGKKIRLFSESNTCEIDFLALQESEF